MLLFQHILSLPSEGTCGNLEQTLRSSGLETVFGKNAQRCSSSSVSQGLGCAQDRGAAGSRWPSDHAACGM